MNNTLTNNICLIQFSYYNTPLAVVLYTLINDHFSSNTNTSSLLTALISKCVNQRTEFKQSKLASQFESCKSITCTQNAQEQQKLIGAMAEFPTKVTVPEICRLERSCSKASQTADVSSHNSQRQGDSQKYDTL